MKNKVSRRITVVILISLIIIGIISYIWEAGQRIHTHSVSQESPPESLFSSVSELEHSENSSERPDSSSEESSGQEWSGPIQVPWKNQGPETFSREIEPAGSPSSSKEYSRGHYINRSVELIFPSGGKLTIGVDTKDKNALYINPHYEMAADELNTAENMSIGYYLSSVYPDYDLFTSSRELFSLNTAPDYESHFLISDRTYDTLIPASYRSEKDFGLCWIDEDNWNGLEPSLNKTIGIRIVRLYDGKMLGIASLQLSYDRDTGDYSIQSLKNADVSATGEIAAETRSLLVQEAVWFYSEKDTENHTESQPEAENSKEEISHPNPIGIFFEEDADWSAETAFVEIAPSTYFTRLYSSSFEPIRTASVQRRTLYAVTVNAPGAAYATLYFSPNIELVGGTARDREKDLVLWGVDLYQPFSRSSVLIRAKDRDFFFPDEK